MAANEYAAHGGSGMVTRFSRLELQAQQRVAAATAIGLSIADVSS